MAGYVRQDVSNNIANGNVIDADDFDNEFNALADAFSVTTGHTHDGSSAEGAPITVVGPVQDVVISATAIIPKTDDAYDLGSESNEWKDLFVDGTANIDTLVADAGTVAGAAITTVSNTQTLTNKTLNLTNNTLVATSAQLAAALTDETGTGSVVFSTSPAFAGTPTAPTAAAGTNTTQLATTAHVFAERTNTATLTNKTLTSPTVVTPTITGGSISGITDLAVADGGTGASTAAGALVNLGLTATAAELNTLDGITASTAELNILDGVIASTAEINILDGVTATTAELNILDGVTSTTAELNMLDGVTWVFSDYNTLTANASELNILDGALITTAELNLLSGITSFATVATSGAYSDLTGTPTLATVATSGAYSDLTGTPTLATVATSGAYSDLTGTPTIPVAGTDFVAKSGGTFTGDVTFGAAVVETVYTLPISSTLNLNPTNGTIQTTLLDTNKTFTDGLSSGESITLMLDAGGNPERIITWPTITWVNNAGVPPTLSSSITVVVIWKVGTTLYGALVGNAE